MSTKIKALTLHQPWASLIALNAKCIETRSWSTRYRGPLAIHAGKFLDTLELSRLASVGALDIVGLAAAGLVRAGYALGPGHIPLGRVVALATLADVQPITPENTPAEPERSFGDYTPGRFAWYLSDVRPLPRPIPAKGGRRLWEWNVIEGMARAAHETADLEEYGGIMSQAHAVLSDGQYALFFLKFLQLRDGEIQ